MKNKVKIIVVPPQVIDPEDIEAIINEWVSKGWVFIQISSFANKTYVVLQRLVVG